MAGGKIVFIIPGFRHKPQNKAYRQIAKILKKEGYLPILVKISWNNSTISENTEYFLKKYKLSLPHLKARVKRPKVYLLGFSYGAMIAFIASTQIKVVGLILCSLSPFFKEDLSKGGLKISTPLTLKRIQDFSSLHCASFARNTKAKKILMLYGTKEEKALIRRVRLAFNQVSLKNKYLIPIKNTEHHIADKRYLRSIHHVVRNFI